MIKNERQAAITRSRLSRLTALEAELQGRLSDCPDGDRMLLQLQLDAVLGEASAMRSDLEAYDELRLGRRPVAPPNRLEELPRALIEARISAGLSQADLANRLGLKEQQIQRYESTEYDGASLGRLIEVANAVGLSIAPAVRNHPDRSAEELELVLDRAGLPKDFLRRRFKSARVEGSSAAVLAGRVAHVYGVPPDEVLQGRVQVERDAVAAAGYKLPARAGATQTLALSGYARYLTRVVAAATVRPFAGVPASPLEFHARIIDFAGGNASYEGALRAAWSLGVPVVPLLEPGGFHAGFWWHSNRPVIVLNPTQRQEARWMFDLLHEFGHLAQGHERALAEQSPSGGSGSASEDEASANDFASSAIFGGRAEELWQLVWRASGGKTGMIQRSVKMVARQQSVDAGALALNVGHRLSVRGTSWWAAANKLQTASTDPWTLTRDVLLEELDWTLIDRLDAQMLSAALVEVDAE